jgi:hypothetical protein
MAQQADYAGVRLFRQGGLMGPCAYSLGGLGWQSL